MTQARARLESAPTALMVDGTDHDLVTERPGHSVDLVDRCARGFIVHTAGDITVLMVETGNSVTIPAIAGVHYPLQITDIVGATTTADDILVVW